ncbi:M56 family metallopeptidase [Rhodococcus sp. P1Y]|uniref:M56 family metallopeptidase n=1 Tax=Rhodococcus sp. P1Y TaxID=1302308 RepID=UPI000EB1F4D9|nr:M56 family metallopeptidase [Rhodococcus sp. P1Y]AYJ47012.1 M56 family peptidase [Rhodococcus sp. P1Y]
MTLLLVVAALPWLMSVALRMYSGRIENHFAPQTTVSIFPILAAVSAFAVAASALAVASVLVASKRGVAVAIGIAILGWVAWRLVLVARHLSRVLASARDAAKFGENADAGSRTVVVDSPEPDAFAVASGGGAVVITTALVDALSDPELNAVIRHERAHLRFRHTFWTQMVEVAAQFDPLLRPVVRHVRHAAERQADEWAARQDRPATMSAVARTVLLRAHLAQQSTALSSTGGDVVRRVRALTEPPPPPQRRPIILAALALIVTFSAISIALVDVVQDVIAPEGGEAPTSVFR